MIKGYPEWPTVTAKTSMRLCVQTDAKQFRVMLYRFEKGLRFHSSAAWFTTQSPPGSDPKADEDWNWPSYPMDSPDVPGIYFAILIEGDGDDNDKPDQPQPDLTTTYASSARLLFIVKSQRPGSTSRIVYKIPLFTYHAYNSAGDGLYGNGANPRRKASIHRPGGGTGFKSDVLNVFESWDAQFISWLFDHGIVPEFCTDLDVHMDANSEAPLLSVSNYQLLISVGHDEYWSSELRHSVRTFRDCGGNIAFFGGNTCWWRIGVDSSGTAFWRYRRGDLMPLGGEDPYPDRDDQQWLYFRTENALTGLSYRNGGWWLANQHDPSGVSRDGVPLGYTVNQRHWSLAEADLDPGTTFGDEELTGLGENGHGLIGYECDGAPCMLLGGTWVSTGEQQTPACLKIIAYAILQPDHWYWWLTTLGPSEWPDPLPIIIPQKNVATMVVYAADSGAIVFNAGTIHWAWALAQNQNPAIAAITRKVISVLSLPESNVHAPSVAVSQLDGVCVFTTTSYGRLWELVVQGEWAAWVNHDMADDAGNGVSAPSASAGNGVYDAVFTVSNGQLFGRSEHAGRWAWENHGRPPGSAAVGAPVANVSADGYIGIFVSGANGHLFERSYQRARSHWVWSDHGLPPSGLPIEARLGTIAAADGSIRVFAVDSDRRVYEVSYSYAKRIWSWADRGRPRKAIAAISSASGVATSAGYLAAFFTAGGKLYELASTDGGNTWSWTDRGHPKGSALDVDSPMAVVLPSSDISVFVRGNDQGLYELRQSGAAWQWNARGGAIATGPGAAVDRSGNVRVFAASGTRALLECLIEKNGVQSSWTEHLPPACPKSGIGGYDLISAADRALAFDYDSSGKLDHVVLYRPGTGAIAILKNEGGTLTRGNFTPVYFKGDPGDGIGEGDLRYDLSSPADRAFAFDYDSSGKLDHLVLYRPGTGAIFILKRDGADFTAVYAQGDPGDGIGGYDLLDDADRALAFDYDSNGKLDHLMLYRPGTGTIWICNNSASRFPAVYSVPY